jgi:transposase-like protein
MRSPPRRNHSPAFKAKVAHAAGKGEKMLAELAAHFDVSRECLDLSRIHAAPITHLGCLAFEGQGAFAPQS